MVHSALARLDATLAQERGIVSELDRRNERVRGVKSRVKNARGVLAATVNGASIDDAELGAGLSRGESAHAEIRTAVIEELRAIHGVLDDKQRAELADMLDRDVLVARRSVPLT